MAKEKKKLTPTQQKRRYNNLSKVCNIGQWGALIAPFVTIALVNYKDYFIEYDGVKMSVAAVLAAFIMGVIVFTVVNKKIENSYGPLIIKVAIFTAILFLIDGIVQDLKFIMLFTLLGLFGALGLEKTSESLSKKADKIQKGIDAGDEERTKNEYLNEVKEKEEKKTIKIKVRKDD